GRGAVEGDAEVEAVSHAAMVLHRVARNVLRGTRWWIRRRPRSQGRGGAFRVRSGGVLLAPSIQKRAAVATERRLAGELDDRGGEDAAGLEGGGRLRRERDLLELD